MDQLDFSRLILMSLFKVWGFPFFKAFILNLLHWQEVPVLWNMTFQMALSWLLHLGVLMWHFLLQKQKGAAVCPELFLIFSTHFTSVHKNCFKTKSHPVFSLTWADCSFDSELVYSDASSFARFLIFIFFLLISLSQRLMDFQNLSSTATGWSLIAQMLLIVILSTSSPVEFLPPKVVNNE